MYFPKTLFSLLFVFFSFCFLSAQPQPCGSNPAMTSFCANACVICDIDGYTGINNLTAQGQGFPEFCTIDYNNMQYIAFVAGSENLTIRVDVGICTGGLNSLEVGFFESFDCETFVPITNCDTDIPSNTSEVFSNIVPLVIGQYYYLVIDGSSSANCDWTFNVLEGTTEVLPLSSSGEVSNPAETCPDFPTTFTTTGEVGAATYIWTANDVIQSVQGEEVELTFAADGEYEVCVTASNVCDSAPPSCSTISVRTPQTLTINETLCFGECVEANGIQFCETGTYQEIITLANGCDSLINIDIEVLPQPQSTIDVWICNDQNFFIGTTPYNETGMYTNTVLTDNDCDSLVFLDLLVIECEITGTTSHIPAICNNTSTGTLIFSVDQGTPPLDYTYTNIADVTITGSGSTNLLINNEIPNIPAGDYQIYISDNFGNDVVLLQEVTEPPVLAISLLASDYGGFNLSCFSSNGIPGNDGTLMADVSGGVPPYQFLWSDGQQTQDATDLLAQTYSLTVTDAYGCTIETNYTMTSPSPIDALVEFRDPSCDGLESGEIEVVSVMGGTPDYSYSLSNSNFQNTPFFTNLLEGDYETFIQDENGCVLSYASSITAPDIPVISFSDGLSIFLGESITIIPLLNETSIADILWVDANTLSCNNCLKPTARPFNTTTYTLTITSDDGCTDTKNVTVNVIKRRRVYVANIFSPNADGINDRLVVNAGIEAELVNRFTVFDRWGNLVYEDTNFLPNDSNKGWDGRFNNKPLNSGSFVWIAEVLFLDGVSVTLSGDVTILP